MYLNLETTFAANCAEQHVVHLRATKLGPLLTEAERKPAMTMNDAGPLLTTIVGRLVDQLRSARLKWARAATELQPARE